MWIDKKKFFKVYIIVFLEYKDWNGGRNCFFMDYFIVLWMWFLLEFIKVVKICKDLGRVVIFF